MCIFNTNTDNNISSNYDKIERVQSGLSKGKDACNIMALILGGALGITKIIGAVMKK